MSIAATIATPPAHRSGGLAWGVFGMVLFSMSLPATRLAVGGFDPVFVASARGAAAGLVALVVLLGERAPWPTLRQWQGLLLVAGGTVLGWPLLTTIAMAHAGAVHGAILTGVLPAATAVAAVLLAHERPTLRFWLAAGAGLLCVLVFAAVQGAGRPVPADGLLLAAVVASALGYAAGGRLSRTMGGLRVIGWALVLCLPVTIPAVVLHWDPAGIATARLPAWAGLAYVAFISQYLGFVAWYRGLSRGGIARIGQVQLAQPVLSMAWAVLLLGEAITPSAAIAAVAVLACVVVTQKAR